MPIQILGVNDIGFESGNATITAGRQLPWLQATASVDVWKEWKPTYRDVVLLDGANKVVGIYNLSSNDLGVAKNYADLRALFVAAANAN